MKFQINAFSKVVEIFPYSDADRSALLAFAAGEASLKVIADGEVVDTPIGVKTAAGNDSAVNEAFLKGYNKGTSDVYEYIKTKFPELHRNGFGQDIDRTDSDFNQ
jgi:hypothetical protein